MVTWTNLFPLDPQGGTVSAYSRIATVNITVDKPWGSSSAPGAYLSSAGAVNTNTGLRIQYDLGEGASFSFWGPFIFDETDEANRAGRVMTGTAYLAPASAFGAGVVPTIAQIRANSVVRSRLMGSRTTAGALKDYGSLPLLTSALRQPNTKYWFALVPSYVANMGVAPTTTSDEPVGAIETVGRAVSLWTNRTPKKPRILTPTTQSTMRAGATLNLTFEPQDDDRIASFPGDGGPNDLDDMSGVQIQYAPKDTEDWADLPISDGIEPPFRQGAGWYIDGQTLDLPAGWDESYLGARRMWLFRRLQIQTGGAPVLTSGGAYLPSGDWKIRLRTFDYGHNIPNSTRLNPWVGIGVTVPALFDFSGDRLNPDEFPAENTSPWSDPITVSITTQVPKPIPLNPTNGIAKVYDLDEDITLSWQYRNTMVFDSPQTRRTVQIRQAGEEWDTVADDESSSSSTLTLPMSYFVSGNLYEWRVQVTDLYEVTSEFSDIARFWIVPVPNSGSVLPDPSDLIDGATLGCGTHRVEFYRRGGKVKVGEARDLSYVKWARVRDDITTAKVVISGWSDSEGEMLRNLKTWAHEIKVWRDNGFSNKPVWEGPITLLTYTDTDLTIQARDVGVYPYRRIIKQVMNDSGKSITAGDTVTRRAVRVLQNVMAPDDPNVLAYLTLIEQDDDAKQYRSLPAYSRTAYEEIDDMAANAGLDYTVVGRRIIVWGTKHRIGTLPEFRDKDLGNKPIVSEYGMSASNVYAVSDGNGTYGEADRLNDTNTDPIYGLIEVLSSTWASDSESEEGTYTQEGLTTIRESFASAAERSIADKYPPPVVVRVPDNTRLHPDTVVDINQLVPGVIIPLRSTATLRHVIASQKLDAVNVVEQNGVETITITMSPFSRDDRAPAEGEGEE